MKYQVMIVEDDPMAQQLFTVFVQQSDSYELVTEIANSDLADIYCETRKIDLIIMDIRTAAHSNGLDAAERIKKKYPEIKVIIVTSMPEYTYLQRARDIGVDSFWYKEVRQEPFYKLMDETMAGKHIFPDKTPEVFLGNVSSVELSSREMEVLKLLVSGYTNMEIADKLFISERTVKMHIQNLLEKTGFNNRTELAVKARDSGLVISDE